MIRRTAALLALVLFGCAEDPRPVVLDFDAIEARLPAREVRGRISDRIPDIEVTNQHGDTLHFFEDLLRDRMLVVNFMYTTCPRICPGTTSNLVRLHEALGPRVGHDVTFVSVSLDPDVDTPEVLHRYWKAFGAHPGWHYVTGRYEEIELLRRRMGVYDKDPVIDADKTQHGGILTLGNDRNDRWVAIPALSTVHDLAEAVDRFDGARSPRFARANPRPAARRHTATGQVESIPDAHRSVVIRHDDIPGLMPAMTMEFVPAQPALLEGIEPGQAVRFEVVRDGRVYRIESLEAL